MKKNNNSENKYGIKINGYISKPDNKNLGNNLIDELISDKIKLLETHINEISKLVDERKSLEEITRSDFTDEILNIRNEVLQIKSNMPVYNTYSDPRITELEKEIIKLKKSKINGKIESWKDVLQLKKDIIDLIIELKKIKSKLDLINNKK